MLLPHLRRWQDSLAGRLTVAIMSTGTPHENREVIDEHAIIDLFIQDGSDVMESYRVDATPSAVVISPDGKIASATVQGARPIEPLVRLTLLRSAAGSGSTAPRQPVS